MGWLCVARGCCVLARYYYVLIHHLSYGTALRVSGAKSGQAIPILAYGTRMKCFPACKPL